MSNKSIFQLFLKNTYFFQKYFSFLLYFIKKKKCILCAIFCMLYTKEIYVILCAIFWMILLLLWSPWSWEVMSNTMYSAICGELFILKFRVVIRSNGSKRYVLLEFPPVATWVLCIPQRLCPLSVWRWSMYT